MTALRVKCRRHGAVAPIVGGLVAFEETAGKDAGLAIGVGHARSIAHETASAYEFPIIIDRRQRTLCGQGSKWRAFTIEKWIGADHQSSNPSLRKRRESCLQIKTAMKSRRFIRFTSSDRFVGKNILDHRRKFLA